MRRSLAWVGVAMVAGCTGAPAVDTGVQSIIGGSPSTADTAIVLFASYPADRSVLDTCTAVLVSPTVLLTAAHCVDATNHPDYTYGIFPGADSSAYPTLAELAPHLLAVASVHPDPDYQPTPPYHADLAVAVLAAPLTGVTPLAMNTDALTSEWVGLDARIIGYGETTYGTINYLRNAASTVVAGLDSGADTITVGDGTHRSCVGDSGGPALVDGVVVALDSYTDTTGCTEPAHYTRVDELQPFIATYVPATMATVDAGVTPSGDAGTTSSSGGGGCDAGGGSGLAAAMLLLGLVRRRRG